MTQAFNLSQLANNLNSAGKLDATDGLVNAVPVANGGTGASSVAAAVSNLSASIYPVGSIYINGITTADPALLLGFGTWQIFGQGRVLIGYQGAGSSYAALVGDTGGSANATLVAHNHTATSTVTDPGHRHSVNTYLGSDGSAVQNSGSESGPFVIGTGTNTTTTGITVATTTALNGSSAVNANIQPYITVSMWMRIA